MSDSEQARIRFLAVTGRLRCGHCAEKHDPHCPKHGTVAVTPSLDDLSAALFHKSVKQCVSGCGTAAWRGHLCDYHDGYRDGLDAAADAGLLRTSAQWEQERLEQVAKAIESFAAEYSSVRYGVVIDLAAAIRSGRLLPTNTEDTP